jgi:hypothetical protein
VVRKGSWRGKEKWWTGAGRCGLLIQTMTLTLSFWLISSRLAQDHCARAMGADHWIEIALPSFF